MSAKPLETLDVRDRHAWRKWLEEHCAANSEIWLVFHKRHTGMTSIPHDDAVEEALCFEKSFEPPQARAPRPVMAVPSCGGACDSVGVERILCARGWGLPPKRTPLAPTEIQ